jgi:acyl-CoA thioesterase
MGEALEIPNVSAAIRLHTDETGGGLIASPPPSLSNAPLRGDPERGTPFGGYMAAAALRTARQQLAVDLPLRTLTIQFMAGARFAPVTFRAERLRGGRSTTFAAVRADQGERAILSSLLTFGDSGRGPEHRPLNDPFPPVESLPGDVLEGPIAPWFTRAVQYRFDGEAGVMGGQTDSVVRVWMRVRDPGPLDELKLAFLLDAVFPNFFRVAGPTFATSVDLRYDFFQAMTPDLSPDGWAFFEFRTADASDGWAVEDGVAYAPDGRPLAVARQLRKVLAQRG